MTAALRDPRPESSLRSGPHQVTREFERELCRYTGAPFAVAVNSCTSALLLACAWHRKTWQRSDDVCTMPDFEIPRRTYVSVPCSIIHAGGRVTFRDEEWKGFYQLRPYPVWDAARWFSSEMYRTITSPDGGFVCVSFHASKTLGIEQGGAILHDDPAADAWFRRARFDGRREGVAPADDRFDMVGWHCYMNPSTAAQGLLRLYSLSPYNAPLPNDPYPDLSTFEAFR